MSDSEEDNSSISSSSEWPVTEEWLLTVLYDYHDKTTNSSDTENLSEFDNKFTIIIDNFAIKPGCESGENVLSDILAVNVNYTIRHFDKPEENCFLGCIVKLLPHDPFCRVFVTEAEFDLREIMFYTEIVPDLNDFQNKHLDLGNRIELPIPKCYHAHHCPNTSLQKQGFGSPSTLPESVLVLENIKLKNFQNVHFSTGLTLRQTKAALKSISKIHAISLAFKLKHDINLFEQYPHLFQTAQATESYQQLVERGLPQLARFLEQFQGFQTILESLTSLKPKIKEIITMLLSPREPISLITHTDFWSNNLMFRDQDECLIYDWQMVAYGHPTNDIALLLISSISTDLRKNHTDEFLDLYWSSLNEYLGHFRLSFEEDFKYNREQFNKDYRRSQLLALLLCVGSIDVALGNPLTEQRLIDVLKDLHSSGVLNIDILNE